MTRVSRSRPATWHTSSRTVAALIAMLCAVACRAVPPDGVYACTSSSDCPPAQRCFRGICRANAPRERSDAGVAVAPASSGAPAMSSTAQRADENRSIADAGQASDAGDADGSGITMSMNDASTPVPMAGNTGTAGSPAAGSSVDCPCPSDGACCEACRNAPDGKACESDGLDCTRDTCRAGRCMHEATSGYCVVAGVCYPSLQVNLTAPCLYCNAALNQTGWTKREAGAVCSDGIFCNGVDTCDDSGQCSRHEGDPCVRAEACSSCQEFSRVCTREGCAP